MEIEVYRYFIPSMIRHKELRRAAEKFKMDVDRQFIDCTYRRNEGYLVNDSVFVKRIASTNYYIFS